MIMKKTTVLLSILLIFLVAISAGLAGEENSKNAAWQGLKANFPGVRAYQEGQYVTRVFGKQFGAGSSPVNTAELFTYEYAGLFGVSPDNLRPGGDMVGGIRTLPLVYNRQTGEYKFTLVYYSQYKNDIPVFRADLRLLTRNEPGYPLVMAASALRDLGDFQIPQGIGINIPLAQNAAKSFYADLINFSQPRLVVWAGLNDQVVNPAVAMEIIADNGKNARPAYEKWLFLVDVQTGGLLYTENMILDTDVSGNVSGMATQGWGADICGPEEIVPLPYVRVEIQGGDWSYADTVGNFTIPNPGEADVTVISEIRGQWFRVFNMAGAEARLTQVVTPPGPANFIHNETNISEYNRAEVNGYVHSNIVRDYTLTYNPTYPTIYTQEQFPCNVNIADYCNAYYDYSSINFFISGSGCSNTAFSTVVHHEYGHHLVAMGGSGQGQYGEGLGDVMGVLISEDPGLAYGFQNNCNVPLRNADNNYQYPCNGEIHDCGQLLSGCIWSTRNELLASYPDEYRDIIGELLVNSIPMHNGDLITPTITIDFLTIDDDDGDIGNGTPHYDEICAGFGVHNMDCPEVILLDFAYPNGLPENVSPYGGTVVTMEVIEVSEPPQSGTGIMHYNDGSGWIDLAMTETSSNVYEGAFPEFDCGTRISFYFSAETISGAVVTDPSTAPAATFSTISATGFTTIFEDNGEDDMGWTVSGTATDGQWDRGIPVNCQRGDPEADYDGSGSCYLTDNSSANNCNSDVDGGSTFLISPTFDLTDMGAIVRYSLWYTNGFGDDPYNDNFNIWISDNGGLSWSPVEVIGPVTAAGWTRRSFVVNDFVTPNSQIKVRFEASDLNLGSIIEAGIDAFQIVKWECQPTGIPEETDRSNIPAEFALIGGYPNPFNASITIKYALPEQSSVTIDIFDLLGRKIDTIVDESKPAGYHQAQWNADGNSSGVYFYRIKAGDFTETRKMLLLK